MKPSALRSITWVAVLACAVLAGCGGTESSAWREAQAADSSDAYAAYLKSHPQGTHAALAASRAKALADQQDWQAAHRLDTVEALAVYLRLHPDGLWVGFARERSQKLKAAELAARRTPAEPVVPVVEAKPLPPPVAPARQPSGDADAAAKAAAPVAAVPAGPQVQLGVFSTRKRATEVWQKAAKQGGAVADATPLITTVRSGGKDLYRLRAVLAPKTSAAKTCRKLVQAGMSCLPVPERKR